MLGVENGALAQEAPADAEAPIANAGQEDESGLDVSRLGNEIVVTAQKREESANDVGMSLNVLTPDALLRAGVTSAEDLVRVVPGFNYTRSQYNVPVFTLRGIGFYEASLAAAPSVTVYVDEVPLPYSIMATGAQLDVQRVEVLKGPQGTLFGQNATGGAINYIAARPTEAFSAGADISVGRFGTFDSQGFVSGPITSALSARAAVRYLASGGPQRSYTRDDTIGGANLLIGRLLLDWTPTERLSVTLNVNGWIDNSENLATQYVGPGTSAAPAPPGLANYPVAPLDNRAVDFDPGTNFDRNDDFYQVSGRVDYEINDNTTFTSITAFQQMNRDSLIDGDGTAIAVFNAENIGRIQAFFQEARISGELGPSLQYIVGGNYSEDKVDETFESTFVASRIPFDGTLIRASQRVKTYAFFGNLDWEFVDGLILQAGLRYTNQRRAFESCTYDRGTGGFATFVSNFATNRAGRPIVVPIGGCGTLDPQTFTPTNVMDTLIEDSVSWRLGLNWNVNPAILLYGNVSRGYKNGAFPTLGATFTPQLAPATQESVLAYEAGFKLTLARRAQLNGAAFLYDYDDKQLRGRRADPFVGVLNALINVPKSRVLGAEMQLNWMPFDGLALNVGGTYIHSEILDDFTNFNFIGQLQNFGGEPFPLTPKVQIVADIQYEFEVSPSLNAFVGMNGTYQSATNSSLGQASVLAIDSYGLIDARAGISDPNDRWRITAWVRNLSDQYYWTYVFSTTDTRTRSPGNPRTFGVTGTIRY